MDGATRFTADWTLVDEVAIVTFSGDLDLAAKDDAWIVMSAAVRATSRLVLDLSGLDFMDSTGLNLLLEAQELAGDGSQIVLRGPRPPVVRLLEITGLSFPTDP